MIHKNLATWPKIVNLATAKVENNRSQVLGYTVHVKTMDLERIHIRPIVYDSA